MTRASVSEERIRKAASELINYRWGNGDKDSAAVAGQDMRFWQLGGSRVMRAAKKAVEKVKQAILSPRISEKEDPEVVVKSDRSSYVPNFVIARPEPQGFVPSPKTQKTTTAKTQTAAKKQSPKVATQAVSRQSEKYSSDFSERLPRPAKIVNSTPEFWGLSPKKYHPSSVPAQNAIPRKIEGVEDLLKMDDKQLVAIAMMGGMQKTPGESTSSPYKWSRGETIFGMGMNEGYSVADAVHFYANKYVPMDVTSKWDKPTRLTEALKNKEITPDNEGIRLGLKQLRIDIAKEIAVRKKLGKKYGFV